MDFKGQHLAEQVYTIILVVAGVLGFAIGYFKESFSLMMLIFASGLALSMLASLPDWPAYNRHPVRWLPSTEGKASKTSSKTAAKKPQGLVSRLTFGLF